MKKKIFIIMMLCLICLPSYNAFAAANAVDLDTGEAGDVLTTYVVTTGSEDELSTYKNYEISIPFDTKEIILPITFDQKGLFYSSANFLDKMQSVYLEEHIYADIECTNEINYSSYNYKAIIPESGTYYIKFLVKDYSDVVLADYKMIFKSQFFTGNDKTLKNKEWVCTGNLDSEKPIYFEVVVPKAGSLTINTETEYSNKITLLNSSKKAISDEISNYKGKVCFAVKEGTYYIKILADSSDIMRIESTISTITDYSGSTKAKAKALKAGKTYTGYLSATDKKGTVDWYKITLTKSQKVEMVFTGSASGEIKLEFYGSNISGSITQYISSVDDDSSFSAETWSSSKLPKGTYYIKVSKEDTNTSGFYKLQLKK